jgi:hypothetical protein
MKAARVFAMVLGLTALATPLAALAQDAPPAAAAPSYAKPMPSGEETISGRVESYDGKYVLRVRDDRGFSDAVQLHQGTVINPRGLTLQPGMRVTILGYNGGRAFAANEIDTPYQSYGFVPAGPEYAIGFGFGPVYDHHWH